MSVLQVLVATMKQNDFSLIEKMNIRCDAIIANQHDCNSFEEKHTDFGKIIKITTPTRGVGLNRNIALLASDADIVLFADDDMEYYDGTLTGVVKAFEELKQADVIIFGVDKLKNGEIIEKRHLTIRRLHMRNAMKYGTYAIAVRREALLKANLKFSHLFGGGCIYGSGEDSLFIADCFKKKLKIYSHSYVLGTCCKDTSSWFSGFNAKYFYDRGALLSVLFPKIKRIMKLYFVFRLRKRTSLTSKEMLQYMNRGINGFKKSEPYRENNIVGDN